MTSNWTIADSIREHLLLRNQEKTNPNISTNQKYFVC